MGCHGNASQSHARVVLVALSSVQPILMIAEDITLIPRQMLSIHFPEELLFPRIDQASASPLLVAPALKSPRRSA